MRWLLLANQRCDASHGASASDGGFFDAIPHRTPARTLETEPVEAVRAEAQEVRAIDHWRKPRVPEQLHRDRAAERGEIELDRLRSLREIRDDENGLVAVLAQEREHGLVARSQKRDRA